MLLPDQILRSKRKSISLTVRQDGSLVVRAPSEMTDEEIQDFVDLKSSWILNHRSRLLAQSEAYPPHQFSEGEIFLFFGGEYRLSFTDARLPTPFLDDRKRIILLSPAVSSPASAIKEFYRDSLKRHLARLIPELCVTYGFTPSAIRVNSAKTRYGSCGGKNTLNFSWRIAMAPVEVIRSVVIPELCHTVHHNHSSSFWKLVLKLDPGYSLSHQWLKEHQAALLSLP